MEGKYDEGERKGEKRREQGRENGEKRDQMKKRHQMGGNEEKETSTGEGDRKRGIKKEEKEEI